jgi:hypothetical protein
MKRNRTFVLALLGAATSVAACSSGEETAEESPGMSARAIDAQIRADLKLALGTGARCHPADVACRSSVLERIARGDRSDAVLAQVIDRVNRLNRADFCEPIDPDAGSVFAVGADAAAASNEVAVVFDLKRFAAAVMTSATDGLATLQPGSAYETIAKANGEFPGFWAGAFAVAEPTLPLPEATFHWSATGGIAGAAKLAAKQEETRAALARLSSIDGSKYGLVPIASATSAIVLAKIFESIGATRKDDLVSFASKAKVRPGAATAIAIAQVAGLDGMGPRAAAMAITFDRAASFPGGVAAYCGKGNAALTTRSLAPRNDDVDFDSDISLGTGFGGLQDRTGSVDEGATLDCSSGLPELECGALYGSDSFCSFNGKGSCCRAPVTDTSDLRACTPGPEAGCADGEVCTRAAEVGPNANSYVCLGNDTCEAFGNSAEAAGGQVSISYEGTCEFLRNCSSFSRGVADGYVKWGCEGIAECSDSDLWVASPRRANCGKTVRICRGTNCVNAKVRDVSDRGVWEGSNGVFDGLGLQHGFTSRCSGFGNGRVTISVP